MIIILSNQKKINSLLIIFIIVISDIANIVVYFTDFYVVGINIILILFTLIISFFNNNFKINKKSFYLLLSLCIFFSINFMFTQDYPAIAISEFMKMIIYGGSALLISTHAIDLDYFKKYWFNFAFLFFIILHFLLPRIIVRDFNYMHAGFIMNFINLGFLLKYSDTKNKVWLILISYIIVLSLFFGHRGSLLVHFGLIFYFLFQQKVIKTKYIIISIPFLLVLTYLIFNEGILIKIYDSFTSYASFFDSRSLRKILTDIQTGNIDLSGREVHYEASFELIKNNFFIIPNGFGKFQFVTGLVFPHNLILELYLVFGVFSIGLIWYFLKSIINITRYGLNEFQLVYGMIFIYSIFRLLSGGSFTTETSFWILIGLSMSYKEYTKKRKS